MISGYPITNGRLCGADPGYYLCGRFGTFSHSGNLITHYTLQINKTAFTSEKTSVWGRFFCMFVIKMEIFFVILSHFPIRDVYKGIFMEVKDGQKTL